jgi:hypothetical protein
MAVKVLTQGYHNLLNIICRSPCGQFNTHAEMHLFFPALAAMRYNPICKAMAERLAANGKEKMEIIGAIMHTRYAHEMF